MAKKDVRPIVTLECTECQGRNYTTEKNRRNDPGRIELQEVLPAVPQAHAAP